MILQKKIFYIGFILLFTNHLNAQINVVLNSNEKKTENEHSSVINPNTSPRNYSFYNTKTYHESDFVNQVAISSNLPTYPDLDKIASNPKSNYLHNETKSIFPYLFGNFVRKQIVVSNDDNSKMSAMYDGIANDKKISFVISLIPSNESSEGRLRNEYVKEVNKVVRAKNETVFFPKAVPVKFGGKEYTCNGIETTFTKDAYMFGVSIYECASWLFKIAIESEKSDSIELNDLRKNLTYYFNPAKLTAVKPLNLKPNVDFEREALKDTVTIGALFGSATKKFTWASENIYTKERYSGFPDMYLNMHIEAWKEYLKILGKKKTLFKSPPAKKFYDELSSIENSGFLAEFIMEQYHHIMIVPADMKLDFENYRRWKEGKDINIDITKKRYTICYRNLPY